MPAEPLVSAAERDAYGRDGIACLRGRFSKDWLDFLAEAIEEDVDVVGLSILSGAHLTLARRVVDGLRARGADDVRVVVGGIVPPRDVDALRAVGVERVFPMGTPLPEIVGAFLEAPRRTP